MVWRRSRFIVASGCPGFAAARIMPTERPHGGPDRGRSTGAARPPSNDRPAGPALDTRDPTPREARHPKRNGNTRAGRCTRYGGDGGRRRPRIATIRSRVPVDGRLSHHSRVDAHEPAAGLRLEGPDGGGARPGHPGRARSAHSTWGASNVAWVWASGSPTLTVRRPGFPVPPAPFKLCVDGRVHVPHSVHQTPRDIAWLSRQHLAVLTTPDQAGRAPPGLDAVTPGEFALTPTPP